MKKISLFFFSIILWGCSAKNSNQIPAKIRNLKNLTVIPANTKPSDQISFKKDAVYSSSKKVLIGRMGGIAVGESGRVFIPDIQQKTIDVFKPDGQFITHIGRKGEGPGEFNFIMNVRTTKNELIAYDPPQQRVVIFNLKTLKFKSSVPIASNRRQIKEIQGAFPHGYFVTHNDSFLVIFSKNHPKGNHAWDKLSTDNLYYPMNQQGKIKTKKILEKKSEAEVLVPFGGSATNRNGVTTRIRTMGYHPPFYGNSLADLSGNDQIYWAWTNEFLIKVYNKDGKYQRAIYYPYKNVPLTRESGISARTPDFIMRGWYKMSLPKTWPALHNMKLDSQNQIWVATIVKNMKVYQWWVLKPNGKLLARFSWPRSKPIQVIKDGFIYAKEKNASGSEEIVRYRISMKPGSPANS